MAIENNAIENNATVEDELTAHASAIYPFLIVFLAAVLALWGEMDFPLVVSFIGDAVLIAAICGCVFMLSKTVGWSQPRTKHSGSKNHKNTAVEETS